MDIVNILKNNENIKVIKKLFLLKIDGEHLSKYIKDFILYWNGSTAM